MTKELIAFFKNFIHTFKQILPKTLLTDIHEKSLFSVFITVRIIVCIFHFTICIRMYIHIYMPKDPNETCAMFNHVTRNCLSALVQ